jgi:hypothetical protein
MTGGTDGPPAGGAIWATAIDVANRKKTKTTPADRQRIADLLVENEDPA